MNAELIAIWTAYAARANAATTRAQLGKLYEEMVGYDLAEDDAESDVEDLRGMCADYLRELCFDAGIHCSEIGL